LNESATRALKDCFIVRQGGIDVSDHAPVVLDLEF
jgi:exonuclease III